MVNQTRIENKKLIVKFMNYTNGRPLTDSLIDSLYNDWNAIIPVIHEIKQKAIQINYFDMVGLEQHLNPFNRDLVSITKSCIEFIKRYNFQTN